MLSRTGAAAGLSSDSLSGCLGRGEQGCIATRDEPGDKTWWSFGEKLSHQMKTGLSGLIRKV